MNLDASTSRFLKPVPNIVNFNRSVVDFTFGSDGSERLANEYEAPVLANIPLSRVIRETSDAGAPISAVDKDGSVAAAYREAAAAVMASLSSSEAPRAPTISMTD